MFGRVDLGRRFLDGDDLKEGLCCRLGHCLDNLIQPFINASIAAIPPGMPVLLFDEGEVESGFGPRQCHVNRGSSALLHALDWLLPWHGLELRYRECARLVHRDIARIRLHKAGQAAVDEDDGRFQALALMDGHDLNGVTIGLESLYVAVF